MFKYKKKTFESNKKFYIPKNESIFLRYIEFGYYHFYDKINLFNNNMPPKCYKLDDYTTLKIYIENLDKLTLSDKNKIKFQLLQNYNNIYQNSNEKYLKFYLILFKNCYKYNNENNIKIEPVFDLNSKIENKNLIEDEFGEMMDNFAFRYELDEDNNNLIKLILFYYNIIPENKFHEFLVNNNNIIGKIISIIIQYNYNFKNINKKDLLLLIKNSDNIEQINKLINLCGQIDEKVNIVNELFGHIYKLIEENEKSLKLTGTYSLINKENKIKDILKKYYDINIRKPTKILLLEMDFDQLINTNLKMQSFKEIKDVMNNLYYIFIEKNNVELKEILNLVNIIERKIHELGVSLILRDEMSNMDIIIFIEEDSHIKELGERENNPYLTDFYRKIYFNKSLDLIDHIKINCINNSFIKQFKKIKFHSIYGQYENYQNLISKLFYKAKNIKEFHKVLKLFKERKNNIINNELFPRKSRETSLEILKTFLRKNRFHNLDINEFSSLFLELIDIIYEFNKEIDRIFNALEYNYTHNIISDLYIKLLNQDKINEKYEFVVQHIIEFLTNSKEMKKKKLITLMLIL